LLALKRNHHDIDIVYEEPLFSTVLKKNKEQVRTCSYGVVFLETECSAANRKASSLTKTSITFSYMMQKTIFEL
jgi:hypothetical protein